ncbi:LysR family transcriptional regulator [Clostridium sp. Marseille-P2415]|uniref:LysR family transcriptional regulator n=1 Tax=Clostridium sp. Marseille-P2415 TaxID=1805471 RepID=UPI000988742E|nr:LysR family transcriptional regulator [Clostridium sp. Marseille-P2415]
MNIEKIKYFIDLIECRNFTDTAHKNFVSQTTISQQIASLEKEFDIQLIDRKKIPVEPTEAGWIFYNDAVIIWKQYQLMKEKMKNFIAHHTLVLRIEYAGVMDIRSLLPSITKFKEMYPNISIELNKVLLKDISDYLQKGLYDIAVTFDSEFAGKEAIITETLEQGSYCAVVSDKHPLYHCDKIHVHELYRYPLIMLDPSVIGTSYSKMLQRSEEDGYKPNIARTADDVESEIFYILTEGMVGFFPEQYQFENHLDRLKIIPIEDSKHRYKIVIASLRNNGNPAVKLFMKTPGIEKANTP